MNTRKPPTNVQLPMELRITSAARLASGEASRCAVCQLVMVLVMPVSVGLGRTCRPKALRTILLWLR